MSDNPADLLDPGSGDRRLPVEGVVVAAPANADALLEVSLPSFDADADTQTWHLRGWTPRGTDLPAVGDRVLVHFTVDRVAWAGPWWPNS